MLPRSEHADLSRRFETANPYHYGLVPEVTVTSGGVAVQKHHALGRIARELVDVQPDRRTAYMGDDGAYTSLFMFIADQGGNLSRGTLYAARWTQTSDANGGAATLAWVRLGHATDREIEALVASGITFGDIFDVSNVDPLDATFTKVKTDNGTEWLRLKPGAEKAAAFLETRRDAALRGATTEFAKMEGVTHNARDKKAYVVISRVERGMLASTTDLGTTCASRGTTAAPSTRWTSSAHSRTPTASPSPAPTWAAAWPAFPSCSAAGSLVRRTWRGTAACRTGSAAGTT